MPSWSSSPSRSGWNNDSANTRLDFGYNGTRAGHINAQGLRLASGRAQVGGLTVTTDSTAGAVTYTIAEMLGGLILRDPNGGARSDVTPTAALIVAGITGAAVDDVFECTVVNTANASEVLTITAGTGVTLVPSSITPTQNESTRLIVRLTNVTSGSEAVVMYALTAGA